MSMPRRTRVTAAAIACLLAVLTVCPALAGSSLGSPEDAQADLLAQRTRPDAARFERARAIAESEVGRAPNEALSWTLLAWARMLDHRFADALEAARSADRLVAGDPLSLALMCDALVELGRYEEAVTVAQRLNDLKPGVPAWIRTARLRFLHNDLEGAIAILDKAANSSGQRGEAAAWTWLELARLHLHAGGTAAAALALDAARRAYPELPAILPVRASLELAQGDAHAALGHYRQALALQPSAEDALAAWRLARQLGQDGVAKHQAALLDGLARLDSAALSRRALAEYFSASGQSARALELARQELAARPDIYSHATLARALAGAGDRAQAQAHARQALALNTPDAQLQAEMAAILGAPSMAREARQ